MMKIYAFKEEELKEITQDVKFSLPIKNPESAIKKRIPDSDSNIGQKLGGFRIRIAIPNNNNDLPWLIVWCLQGTQ